MLENLYGEVWEVVIPEAWRKTNITALYKNKGSRKDAKNYRGLSIGSTFLKFAMAIALERIRPWYNKQLLPNQNVFRQFHGCDHLTVAYDWCVRKWLFHTVFNRIIPAEGPTLNCVRIIEELYKRTLSCMKDEDDFFETSSGVRQGGSESPCLFNLYLDYIMRIYENEARKHDLGLEISFRIKDQARDRAEGQNY